MEDLQPAMKKTYCALNPMTEAEMAAVCGGDSFARDAGQFIGGMLGFVHDHPILGSTATMILPPAGLLMAVVAGVCAAVDN